MNGTEPQTSCHSLRVTSFSQSHYPVPRQVGSDGPRRQQHLEICRHPFRLFSVAAVLAATRKQQARRRLQLRFKTTVVAPIGDEPFATPKQCLRWTELARRFAGVPRNKLGVKQSICMHLLGSCEEGTVSTAYALVRVGALSKDLTGRLLIYIPSVAHSLQ